MRRRVWAGWAIALVCLKIVPLVDFSGLTSPPRRGLVARSQQTSASHVAASASDDDEAAPAAKDKRSAVKAKKDKKEKKEQKEKKERKEKKDNTEKKQTSKKEQKQKNNEGEAAAKDKGKAAAKDKAKKSVPDETSHLKLQLANREKNTRFVTVKTFNNQTYVDIREFYKLEGDEVQPGTKGVMLSIEDWSALKDAIPKIDAELKKNAS